jgi:hypothetical protein
MDFLGCINAEGGPILVADSSLIPHWKGIEGEDYDRTSAIFDGNPELEGSVIDIGAGKAILWEMKGDGTADAYKHSESHFSITRIWPHDPADSAGPQLIADKPVNRDRYIGDLVVESGSFVILWAPENGTALRYSSETEVSRPIGGMAIDSAGLVVRVSHSSFACFHDSVETQAGIGRRLTLIAR